MSMGPGYPGQQRNEPASWGSRARTSMSRWWWGSEGPITVSVKGPADDFSFVAPASGEAYAFLVEVRCRWYATSTVHSYRDHARATAALREEIVAAKSQVRCGMESMVRAITRQHLPHRPADVERAVAAAATASFSQGTVTCTPTVRASVGDEVRRTLEDHTHELVRLDQRLERGRTMLEITRQLRDEWRGFLDEGLADLDALGTLRREAWMAPYALRLAEDPKDVASVLQEMLDKRLDEGDKLLKKLGGMIQQGQHLDVYDFLLQSDVALRSTLEGLGVRLPKLKNPHPFGDDAAPDAPPHAPAGTP